MKFMGSKSRVADKIVPLIQERIGRATTYWEPFCGGCNVIDRVSARRRIASDINGYLIAMLQRPDKLKDLPASISKEVYDRCRTVYRLKSNDLPDWYVGAIGFLASYNGRFYDGGYAGVRHTKGGVRDYYAEARRNLLEQLPRLKGVEFVCCDYRSVQPDGGWVIYCDPPYEGVKRYADCEFNHNDFWEWVRKMSVENDVLVSEKSAPPDFKSVWSSHVVRTIDHSKRVKSPEQLFVWDRRI